ncbi:hypothetical protein [Microbulbifer sp. THAF38]|uniref:hypothetical protein n=1 Tax=Microbulbifer sp. THAF38 TaxID=2587856 RepID=UPI001267CCDE|nr:hypothetical protein [Microbulbifer sp. THAF38]QFT54464.1 hypothetical protein FIU95_07845 [Microbulbifer sp. THAF38]
MEGVYIAVGVAALVVAVLVARYIKRTVVDGAPLKSLAREFGEELRVESDSGLIRDYVRLPASAVTACTGVKESGVVIYSVGVCSVLIPWSSVVRINVTKKTKSHYLAELSLEKDGKSISNVFIPWQSNYKQFVPASTGYAEANA